MGMRPSSRSCLLSLCLLWQASPSPAAPPASLDPGLQELRSRIGTLRERLPGKLAPPMAEGLERCLRPLEALGRGDPLARAYADAGEARVLEARTLLELATSWLRSLEEEADLSRRLPLPDAGGALSLLEAVRDHPGGGLRDWVRFQGLSWLDRTGFFEACTGTPFLLRSEALLEAWLRSPDGLSDPEGEGLAPHGETLRALAGTLADELRPRRDPPRCLQDFTRLGARHFKSQLPWQLFEERSLLRRHVALTQIESLAMLEAPPRQARETSPTPAPQPTPPPEESAPSPTAAPPGSLALALLGLGLGGAWWASRRTEPPPLLPPDPQRTRISRPPAPPPPAASPAPTGNSSLSADAAEDLPDRLPGDPGRTRPSRPRPVGEALPEGESPPPRVPGGGTTPHQESEGAPPERRLPTWLRVTLEESLGSRYQDPEHLGSGGMGSVVRAWDQRLERPVAIKIPPPHLADHPEFRQRFLREARALARLHHDNVARVFDVPEVSPGQSPVMILEYLEGQDLQALLQEQGVPPPDSARDWILQAGRGLAHAHAREVLHRDVKPANLMLVEDGIKVLDFGLATLPGAQKLTRSGVVMGSLPYMAPEQLAGLELDERTDEYGLAATAFELFTGSVPFAEGDVLRQEIPRASERRPGLGPELDEVLALALDPIPRNRYAGVADFLEALEAVEWSPT